MFGVINGCCIKNDHRVEDLNKRIHNRNIPSSPLPPSYSIRPVSTKYSKMPILDQYKAANIPANNCATFSVETTFNPGNAQAPWTGYASSIHTESALRNQFFALQRGDQGVYIPSSNSDLYNVEVSSKPMQQPFPGLFETQNFEPFDPNPENTGNQLFQNHTRIQRNEL
jgi:hypothetical protein